MPRRGIRKLVPRISGRRALALLAVGAFVVAAGWLVFAVGAANVLRGVRPDLALNLAPFDARARAGLAEQTAVRAMREPPAQEETLRLAREALERDPTLVNAWRTIALIEELQGRRAQAARL